jgi:hypothetical protein
MSYVVIIYAISQMIHTFFPVTAMFGHSVSSGLLKHEIATHAFGGMINSAGEQFRDYGYSRRGRRVLMQ